MKTCILSNRANMNSKRERPSTHVEELPKRTIRMNRNPTIRWTCRILPTPNEFFQAGHSSSETPSRNRPHPKGLRPPNAPPPHLAPTVTHERARKAGGAERCCVTPPRGSRSEAPGMGPLPQTTSGRVGGAFAPNPRSFRARER